MAVICKRGAKPRNVAAYFLIGLVNNVGFVIMVAGAKNIAEAGVALVYLANIVPSTGVKVTAPLWFDRVSYNVRLVVCTVLMTASFLCVALTDNVGSQLVGVALGSLSCGLGEASFLAMAHYFESSTMLAAWSSGTGLAGIVGYLWVILINVVCKASFEVTILVALVWPVIWLITFFVLMDLPPPLVEWVLCGRVWRAGCRFEKKTYSRVLDENGARSSRAVAMLDGEEGYDDDDDAAAANDNGAHHGGERHNYHQAGAFAIDDEGTADEADQDAARELRAPTAEPSVRSGAVQQPAEKRNHLTCATRLQAMRGLWVYMVPLFLVYFSEYAMQSGTWSAIGFPVTDVAARKDFYLKANLAYQSGVFVSRSSACLVKGSLPAVWLAPLLQTALLIFFVFVAADHIAYMEWPLVALGFVTGLFGGFVYVNAFTLIAARVTDEVREFSLSAASMADSFGIIASDICALFIQACLYDVNGIVANGTGDAHVQCPFNVTTRTNTSASTMLDW
eukprot:INCI19812.1.p1 GENE.INCI19812.1~~INCI19812.1.p1  ORF type:complete len:543 (-),score=82.00 INCI19812.1:222-1742(-)